MLKANNPDIEKKATYAAPDTHKWISVEREINDRDNASVLGSLSDELYITKAPAN